jgi:hypothetical protein
MTEREKDLEKKLKAEQLKQQKIDKAKKEE